MLHYIAGMANGDYVDIGREQAGNHFEALLAAK